MPWEIEVTPNGQKKRVWREDVKEAKEAAPEPEVKKPRKPRIVATGGETK